MSDLVVFEDSGFRELLPLTYWRATFELRCGMDSLLGKIERVCRNQAALCVRSELAEVVAARCKRSTQPGDATRPRLFLNGRAVWRSAPELPLGTAAWSGDTLLAAHVQSAFANKLSNDVLLDPARTREVLAAVPAETLPSESYSLIDYPWRLVGLNAAELRREIGALILHRTGRVYPDSYLLNAVNIHVGAGALIKPGAVLDAEAGPIYVDAGAVVSPNASVAGPCYIGPNTLILPAAIIRENTSIGAWCKVGGEVEGTIIHGYSNKQHHGFLGHAYVAEWVNLGAGTTNSDLKNTYGPVRVPINGKSVDTGETFVGCFIGDHAKTGINTTIPTGAVIGFASNVFVSRSADRFTPSFAWHTDDERTRYDPQRAAVVARTVMGRRKVTMSAAEETLFKSIAVRAPQFEAASTGA